VFYGDRMARARLDPHRVAPGFEVYRLLLNVTRRAPRRRMAQEARGQLDRIEAEIAVRENGAGAVDAKAVRKLGCREVARGQSGTASRICLGAQRASSQRIAGEVERGAHRHMASDVEL